MHRRSFLTLLSAAAAGSALAACSTGSADEGSASTPADPSGAGGGSFPVEIKHAFGTTTIKSAPARVATLGWTDHDTVLALGVAPVGATKITYGGNKKGSTEYFDAELKKVGGKQPVRYSDADGAPIDEVAKTRPDLIVATNSGITKEEYTKLSKIAPVIAYPGKAWGTSWQTSLDLIGKALGRSGQATKLKAKTEKVIKDAVAKYPAVKGKSVVWCAFSPTDMSKFSAYTSLDMRTRTMTDFGMPLSPTVTKMSKGTDKFFVEISAEKASSLDADVVVFYVEKKGQVEKLRKHALLGKIPALKSGAFVPSADPVVDNPMSSPTPLSIPVAVKTFLPKLAAAAGKAKA